MNRSINATLSESVGKKILVMTQYYPFFLVGELKSVGNEEIWVEAEFGVSAALKSNVFQIRIDAISAMFAENETIKMPNVW